MEEMIRTCNKQCTFYEIYLPTTPGCNYGNPRINAPEGNPCHYNLPTIKQDSFDKFLDDLDILKDS